MTITQVIATVHQIINLIVTTVIIIVHKILMTLLLYPIKKLMFMKMVVFIYFIHLKKLKMMLKMADIGV